MEYKKIQIEMRSAAVGEIYVYANGGVCVCASGEH